MFRIVSIILIIFALAATMWVLQFGNKSSLEGEVADNSVLSETSTEVENSTVTYEDQEYVVSWAKVDANNVVLIPNFSEKEVAKKVFEDNECSLLVNSGFYTSDSEINSPIGHFEKDSILLSSFQTNSLFNGIISINEIGTPRITKEVPDDALKLAVQTGPILVENDDESKLSLTRDKNARRMVAGVTGSNELVFMAVYSPKSTLTGPLLEDLPEILSRFEEEIDINLADAINLDGGAASTLYATDFSLSEVSPIGSFFCVK